ncbi:MAG: argininosuccinate lyase [Armatimonadetes bacterium]|nr:argininosuccinate lyase [Armatimonadota bacterium]MDW8121905.1 argininosuccinate lyase [Armatimonadota bacterium]
MTKWHQQEFVWEGVFRKSLDPRALAFSASFPIDKKMWREDLIASLAHALMLQETGIVDPETGHQLIKGLISIYQDIERGHLQLIGEYEDIHSFVEAQLISRIGEAGGSLHTGRSRNDQVVTDFRLWCRSVLKDLSQDVLDLQTVLFNRAREETETILPGYTHLQHAQPVTLAHHLLAHFWAFERDQERLKSLLPRINRSPLGGAALAGTGLPIDPALTAKLLGFATTAENSMDAVSDRDFAAEMIFVCSLIGVHLSRLASELILWATPEFGFVTIDESWSTGSSLMPQKRNPDMAEHIRGRSAKVIGRLSQIVSLLRGLPLTYNSDLQEDKEATFDSVETVRGCLMVATHLMATVAFHRDRMRQAVEGDWTAATDLADYLVRKGVPFRKAHRIVGRLVADVQEKGMRLEDLSVADFVRYHPDFDEGVMEWLRPEKRVRDRVNLSGPSPEAVAVQLRKGHAALKKTQSWLKKFPDIAPTLKSLLSAS